MKKLVFVFLWMSSSFLGFGKEPESKTFLVLFDAGELAGLQTEVHSIAGQLSPFFPTQVYGGNSELVLLVEIPSAAFNECLLGEYWLTLADGRRFQLQELAFRLFDLSENKALHQRYVQEYEALLIQKKKNSKPTRMTSLP